MKRKWIAFCMCAIIALTGCNGKETDKDYTIQGDFNWAIQEDYVQTTKAVEETTDGALQTTALTTITGATTTTTVTTETTTVTPETTTATTEVTTTIVTTEPTTTTVFQTTEFTTENTTTIALETSYVTSASESTTEWLVTTTTVEAQTYTTTTITTATTTTSTCGNAEPTFKPMPTYIQKYIDEKKAEFPYIRIGAGLFSLDGSGGYWYNPETEISGGCTVKAAYAKFVLNQCEKQGIGIWETKINGQYIGALLSSLLKISDNDAYDALITRFSLQDFQKYLNQIGGQRMKGLQYGSASVHQRYNEWMDIYSYINSGERYSETLKTDLTGHWKKNNGAYGWAKGESQWCYLVQWIGRECEFIHKSGWSGNGLYYNSAADCAIIDGKYLAIIITDDYGTGVSHVDVVRGYGYTVDSYIRQQGGIENVFN